MNVLRSVTVFLAASLCLSLGAQDPQFSQYYALPTHLNPALTGGFPAKYRVSAIYRDQWRGPLERSISTFGAALDLRFDIQSTRLEGDAAAVGLKFLSDQAGPVDLSTNSIALSGAYHKSLNNQANKYLSAGVTLTTVQRNILYENLVFQDQFDGVNAFTGPTSEDLPENNFSYSDFTVGVNFVSAPPNATAFYVGAGVDHALQPEVSFYKNDSDEDQQLLSSSELFTRYFAHGGITTRMSENADISPRVFFTSQGPHTALNLGTNFILEPARTDEFKFHLGSWLRIVQDFDDAIQLDAIGFMAGFGINDLLIGLSYDLNLRDLVNYRTGQGALEVSISYFGNYEVDGGACPTF